MENYDFEKERIIKEIKRRKAKKILVQLPEGLKKEAFRINDLIRKNTNTEIFISGDSCWGGCDLGIEEAKRLKCDLIIHFGHAPFVKSKFPVIYAELKSKIDILSLLKKKIKNLKIKNIGLASSVQHIDKLDKIKKYLEENGKNVLVSKKKGFSAYEGHILGCEYKGLKEIKNEVDGYLVIGNKFHALGAALSVIDKDVYLFDEHNNNLELMNSERDKVLKQRAIIIDKVRRADKIGILASTKLGQYNLIKASRLRKELEEIGKEAIVITANELNPEFLMNFYDAEAFINTACPRIGIDDFNKYERPIITLNEADVILGRINWNELLERGFI